MNRDYNGELWGHIDRPHYEPFGWIAKVTITVLVAIAVGLIGGCMRVTVSSFQATALEEEQQRFAEEREQFREKWRVAHEANVKTLCDAYDVWAEHQDYRGEHLMGDVCTK